MIKSFLYFVSIYLLASPFAAFASEHEADNDFVPPIWSAAPFLVMLLVIALFPLIPKLSEWWEDNKNRAIVSVVLGVPVAVYIWMNAPEQLHHTSVEYFQFISLLASLFVTAGGIHISGDLQATPRNNSIILFIGYVLASFIGTTGAAMVLIYPILRANSERKHVMHTVIFFIFLVCNTGGLLSPIGDPPLFLGFLKGIDFFWFLKLFPLWLVNGILLFAIYFALDTHYYNKEEHAIRLAEAHVATPVRPIGSLNLIFLLAIVVSVAAAVPTPYREGIMYLMIICSLIYWKKSKKANQARILNRFTFHAIIEVAVVFAGIFATMMPALILLNKKGAALGVDTPLEFFYLTGTFSSFLDNAPTFLVFLELGLSVEGLQEAAQMMTGEPAVILGAISAGAVFMGANTYIGNAPNFMVRAISEEQKVKMPSFFGYMIWSVIILIPVLSIVAYLFFVALKFPLY